MMREIRTLFTGAILLIGTLAFAPAPSQADENPPPEDNPYARDGFYVGLAGSFGIDTAAENELEKQSGLSLAITTYNTLSSPPTKTAQLLLF